MTRTKEQVRKAIFGKLQGLRRKLHACGVPCIYRRSVVSHASGDIGFTITYRVADDGTTLVPQVAVRTAEGTENLDHLPLDQGLARLKELFQAQPGTNGHAENSDTPDDTDDQARDSNSDIQPGDSNAVVNPNQTPFIHEGDAK